MPLELVQKRIIGGVMILMKLRLIMMITLVVLLRWDIMKLIHLVCMIQRAMSGNGHVQNLIINIMEKKNSVLQKQAALFSVAAHGSSNRGSCARLTVPGPRRLTAT